MKVEHLVIITGLSGSGKTLASRALEDMGYICIDGMPVHILESLLRMGLFGAGESINNLVLVMDSRDPAFPARGSEVCRRLGELTKRLDIVFLVANQQILEQRFVETRRSHPWAQYGSVTEAIAQERESLAAVREIATFEVDTSDFTPHDLRRFIQARFSADLDSSTLTLRLISFGFKYGPPVDAMVLMDVRFLPNPFFVDDLRELNGLDDKVARYVLENNVTRDFMARFTDMLAYLLPHYRREGKTYLTIGIGCTGGRHRSVAIVEAVGVKLAEQHLQVHVHHRDIDK